MARAFEAAHVPPSTDQNKTHGDDGVMIHHTYVRIQVFRCRKDQLTVARACYFRGQLTGELDVATRAAHVFLA